MSNQNHTDLNRTEPDGYARGVSRVAAAQICENVGFQSCQDSALDALAEIIVRYLRDLGRVAASNANLARRTECNVFDVIRGLEDLGFARGVSGGSNVVVHCLSGSGVVKDLVEYVGGNEDVPFALPLTRFPVVVERRRMVVPSFEEMGEMPGKHIPVWLPAFPDPHTYVFTPMWNERKSDPKQDKVEQVRQRRKAERALLGLQQRLNLNGAFGLSSAVSDLVDSKEVKGNGSDPFLGKPLQSENISLIESPDNSSNEAVNDKNPVTVLEAFAPAIEAAKSGVCELGDGDQRGVLEKRPLIFLKVGSGRKLLGRASVLSLQSRNHKRRKASLLGRDDARDDKKRRAEFILRQSMENPEELTQL